MKNINILFLSLAFCVIVILRKGMIYTFASDTLWVHFFTRADGFALENDILSSSQVLQRNYWIMLTRFISSYLGPLTVYYIYYFINTFFQFFLVFKIFQKISESSSIIKYILIGMTISNIVFISGSLVYIPAGGANYKETSYILILSAVYFLIANKRYYISQVLYFLSAIIHLPSSVAFLPLNFAIIVKKKFRPISLILFILFTNICLIFYFSGNTTFDQIFFEDRALIKELFEFRIPYLFFENWKFVDQISFILIYLNIIILILKVKKVYRTPMLAMLFSHLVYLLFVNFTNELTFLSIFKYGFDLRILIIILIFEFINKLKDELTFNFYNTAIFFSVMEVFLFNSQFVLLLFFGVFILLDKRELLFNKFF